MAYRQDVKNSAARIWTKTQFKQTLTQCKANGFTVNKLDSNMTQVIDPRTDTLVVSGMLMNNMWLVRIDQSYFES